MALFVIYCYVLVSVICPVVHENKNQTLDVERGDFYVLYLIRTILIT